MLKKVLIGLAVILVLAAGAGGYEAYQLYTGAANLLDLGHPTLPSANPCTPPASAAYAAFPKLLPWSAGTSASATPTPTPAKVKACLDPENNLPTLSDRRRINILLLGTDTDCKFQKGYGLTQTVFVVTIDPVHKKVGMLSIPRDSYLEVPGFGQYKMDEAFLVGENASTSTDPNKVFLSGVRAAESTIEYNFGIPIKYFAWVGLGGFVKVINTLHGVDINALHPIVDDSYPADQNGSCYGFNRVYIPSGPQYMNGSTALPYVRSRHADLNGDYGRGQRQLQLIVALRPKIDSLGLTDLLTVQNLVSQLQGYVKSNLGLDKIGSYVSFAKGLNLNQIHKLVLTPPYYSSAEVITRSDGSAEDIVSLNMANVLPVVDRMFAPIPVHPRRHHHHPVFVTSAQAAVLLSTVSGAVKQPPTVAPKPFSGTLPGSIYFVDNGNVWRYSSSGVEEVTHTTAIASATITNNGHKLAYYRRWTQNNADVWTKNLKTGVTRQITKSRDGNGYLTNMVNCEDYPFCGYTWNVNPVISPNGRTVLFSSDTYKDQTSGYLTLNLDCNTSPENNGIDLALYAYNVRNRSTSMETAPCLGAGGDADVHFNPKNPNEIVYTEFYYLPNYHVASRLVTLNLATNARRRITPFRGSNMQAAWSPSGTKMAWIGSTPQSTVLYEAPFVHGRLHRSDRKVIDRGLVCQPEFSPDGKYLVYYKLVGSDFQMWIVTLRGGMPKGHPQELMDKSDLTATAPITWIK